VNLLKVWLLIAGILTSLSGTAAVGLPDLQSQSHNQTIVHQPLSLPSVDGLARKIARRMGQDSKPQFDNSLPPTQLNRSLLFLSEVQAEPEFAQIFELGFVDKDFAKQYTALPTPLPWYMRSTGKDRLSGWKDGNHLYKAKLTYHS
jgi:hypothetical protein